MYKNSKNKHTNSLSQNNNNKTHKQTHKPIRISKQTHEYFVKPDYTTTIAKQEISFVINKAHTPSNQYS